MADISREDILERVRKGFVEELLVKNYRDDAHLWKELRIDTDDLDDFVYELLVEIGVKPDSVDTAVYEGECKTPLELVDFILWCSQR